MKFSFEDARGKCVSQGTFALQRFAERVDRVEALTLKSSFGTLLVEMVTSAGLAPHILVNGAESIPRIFGNIAILRVPLDRDLSFHRVSVVAPPFYALTVDLSVEHHYFPIGSVEPLGVTKWTALQLESELTKYNSFFEFSNQRGALPDNRNTGLKSGKGNAAQLLLQVIGRLEALLLNAHPNEVNIDFHKTAPGDFNRDAILSSIKQNSRHLSPSERGSVHFAGLRYTTSLSQKHIRRTATVDFSEVAALLSACSALIRKSTAPHVSALLLSALVAELGYRFPFKERLNGQLDAVLERRMHSPFGALVQESLRTLVGVVTGFLERDQSDSGLLWLKQTVQDRDVFQASVFACCAKSFGFNSQDIASSLGLLIGEKVQVADANRSKGLNFFNEKVVSWRANSSQQSGYRPDTFVMHQGVPVIIDAKFRIGASVWQVADADGLKDVQAYMDDFQLSSAVVIVPKILNEKLINSQGYVSIEGPRKRILVVALQDSDDIATQNAIKKAVELAAQHP